MMRLADIRATQGALYEHCGLEGCPGVLMPYEGDVQCSESITLDLRDRDEGGEG